MLAGEYEVETAHGGKAALEALSDEFDAVVLDRNMPTMSGDELAAKVRGRGLDCRLIMITAVEPDMDIVDLGIDDYLTKPVEQDELKACLESALEWGEYDDTLQDYFALQNKREVLLKEGSDIQQDDRFSEIEQRLIEAAERGLQKNEEVLQTLIQSSPAAIISLDEEGKIDIWNQSAEEIFGWSHTDVVGEDPPMFTSEAEEWMEDIRAKLFGDTMVTDVHVECVTETGTRLDISLSASPLYDTDGNMYGTMFVMTDISERKQREQRLNVMSRVLRHNIRNELNIVLGRIQVLRDFVPEDEQEHIDVAIDQTRKLLDISDKAKSVQEVLDKDPDDLEVWDVEQTINDITTRLCREYDNVTVETKLESDASSAISAKGLYRALWELVENAIEHNERDSPTVKISLETEQTSEGELLAIRVSDDGPGIPQHEIDVVERGEEDPLAHGSGIGLWAVRWIVDRSGGELRFGQNEFGGTEISLLLPRPDDDRIA